MGRDHRDVRFDKRRYEGGWLERFDPARSAKFHPAEA